MTNKMKKIILSASLFISLLAGAVAFAQTVTIEADQQNCNIESN